MFLLLSFGGRTRTSDLRVMSPTSYQLLYPAMRFVSAKVEKISNSAKILVLFCRRATQPHPYQAGAQPLWAPQKLYHASPTLRGRNAPPPPTSRSPQTRRGAQTPCRARTPRARPRATRGQSRESACRPRPLRQRGLCRAFVRGALLGGKSRRRQ